MQQQVGADLFGDHLKGCFTLISGAGLGRLRLGEWGWGSWGSLASWCSLCRLSSMVSSGVLVFLSQLGAPKVCVLSWAEASHIVPSAPFYWGAVTKIGQVPGKGSWTPPPRGEKSVSACGRAGGMENTVAPRWLLGNRHVPGGQGSHQGLPCGGGLTLTPCGCLLSHKLRSLVIPAPWEPGGKPCSLHLACDLLC